MSNKYVFGVVAAFSIALSGVAIAQSPNRRIEELPKSSVLGQIYSKNYRVYISASEILDYMNKDGYFSEYYKWTYIEASNAISVNPTPPTEYIRAVEAKFCFEVNEFNLKAPWIVTAIPSSYANVVPNDFRESNGFEFPLTETHLLVIPKTWNSMPSIRDNIYHYLDYWGLNGWTSAAYGDVPKDLKDFPATLRATWGAEEVCVYPRYRSRGAGMPTYIQSIWLSGITFNLHFND